MVVKYIALVKTFYYFFLMFVTLMCLSNIYEYKISVKTEQFSI